MNKTINHKVILELRAGVGGDEAALFVKDLVGMYRGYSKKRGWKFTPLDFMATDFGGYKYFTVEIDGAKNG